MAAKLCLLSATSEVVRLEGRSLGGREPPQPPSRGPRLPLAAVGGAPLQRDPQHAVAQPHEERAGAVQDAEAAQGLAAPGGQDVQLLQIAAAEAAARRGQRLQDGARLCRGQMRVALKAQPSPRPLSSSPPGTGLGGEGSPVPM